MSLRLLTPVAVAVPLRGAGLEWWTDPRSLSSPTWLLRRPSQRRRLRCSRGKWLQAVLASRMPSLMAGHPCRLSPAGDAEPRRRSSGSRCCAGCLEIRSPTWRVMDAKGEPAPCGRPISRSSRAQEHRVPLLLSLPRRANQVPRWRHATFECLRQNCKVSALFDPRMPARQTHIIVIRIMS